MVPQPLLMMRMDLLLGLDHKGLAHTHHKLGLDLERHNLALEQELNPEGVLSVVVAIQVLLVLHLSLLVHLSLDQELLLLGMELLHLGMLIFMHTLVLLAMDLDHEDMNQDHDHQKVHHDYDHQDLTKKALHMGHPKLRHDHDQNLMLLLDLLG